MKQRYLLTISLTIVLILGFNSRMIAFSQSQIYVGPPTHGNSYFETDNFECTEICRISWEASHYGISASFYFHVLQVGTPPQRQARFYGVLGMTYFYNTGKFYFQVYAHAGIRSWHILVEPLSVIQSEPQSFFKASSYGDREINTEIFVCSEYCTISWTTKYDELRIYAPANFSISIIKLGKQNPVKIIHGYCVEPGKCYNMNGIISLIDNGTFYFHLSAHQLDEWEIRIEDTPTPLVPEGNLFCMLIGNILGGVVVIVNVRYSRQHYSK